MAQAPVLHDFEVTLNHVDRGIEQQLHVRTARHSSETVERVWLRLIAYCMEWEERLEFGPGLSEPDSPDLLATDLTGQTTLWMKVGKADPAKVQRASNQNSRARIVVLFESAARMEQFVIAAAEEKLNRLSRVELWCAPQEVLSELGKTEGRRAKASVTIVGDHLYLERGGESFDGPFLRTVIG
jgi:uncharacterized protein YaeQ